MSHRTREEGLWERTSRATSEPVQLTVIYKASTFSDPDNGADPPQTPAAIRSRYMNLALEWQTLCEALYRHHRFGNSSQQPYEVGTILAPFYR